MSQVSVLFLGSGDAFNAQGRGNAGYLIRCFPESWLLDCGATVLAALKQQGIPSSLIDFVLISHLHGDHFAGLPFLFLEYVWLEKRKRPLDIVGPPGTEQRVMSLFRSMYAETAAAPLPFPVTFHEVRDSTILQLGQATVEPFQVPHQEDEISLGFSLNVAGRRIVYSGDSGWTEELVRRAGGASLFICECSFFETRLWSHLDYPRLVENRARFNAHRIILTHLGQEVLAHRGEIDMEMAEDGLLIEL